MLHFESPKLDDANAVRDIVRRSGLCGNDLNFVNLYLHRNKHQITICVRNGILFRHYNGKRLHGYSFPIGPYPTGPCPTDNNDPSDAVTAIEEDAAERGRPLDFCLMTEDQRKTLERIRPGKFRFLADRGDADYLYLRDRLASLSGRKFHRKRNAVSRFNKDHSDRQFIPMTDKNVNDALTVANRWFQSRNDSDDPVLRSERDAVIEAALHFSALGLIGGLLYVDGIPAAMSIVSQTTDDVFDVHFEKSVPEWPFAYSVICHETARLLSSARLINREEDLNLPSLRTAKLSWFPAAILWKFQSRPIQSPTSPPLPSEFAESPAEGT